VKSRVFALFLIFLLFSPLFIFQRVLETKAESNAITAVFEILNYDGYLQNASKAWTDAWAGVSGTMYNTTVSTVVGDWIFFGAHYLRRGYMYFNTSNIPDDAIINSWYISVNVTARVGTGFSLIVVNGQPTYPRVPLNTYDFNKDYYSVSSTSNCSLDADTVTTKVYNDFTVSTEGSWINPTGLTKLCLRADFDINNEAPTGSKYISFRAYETDASNPYSPPRLYVTYSFAYKQSWVYLFDETERTGWYTVGAAPYLNNDTSNYIYSAAIANMSWFHFQNVTFSGADFQVWMHFEWKTIGSTDVKRLKLRLHNGTAERAWGEYYLTASWAWKSVNVTSFIDTVTEVNNAKIKLESLTPGSFYVMMRRCYLQIYEPTDDLPTNVYHGNPPNAIDKRLDTTFTAGTSCAFKVKWQTDYFQDRLSHYIFSWNATGIWQNDTARAFSGNPTVAWSNVTKTLPSANQTVLWRMYANMSGNIWSSTPIYPLWTIGTTEASFVENIGLTTLGGRNAFRYDGAISAIYVPFTNSTTEKYMITAYDLTNDVWIEPVEIADAPKADPHWVPSIGAFPNGSLVIFWGYYETIKYRVTTVSADLETNLALLLNSFSPTIYSIPDSPLSASYPMPFAFKGESLIVFYRDEVDNWCYSKFNGSSWESRKTIIQKDESTYRFYPFYYKQNATLIMGWYRKVGSGADRQDMGLIFTDTQAVTWKFWNGTIFTPPINDTAIAMDIPSYWGGISAVLDDRNVPYVLIAKPWWEAPLTTKIAVYSSALGTVGDWKTYDVLNEFNETLIGKWSPLFTSNNRVALCISPTKKFPDAIDFHKFKLAKYVITNVPYRFQPLSEFDLRGELSRRLVITDSTEIYEMVAVLCKAGILGLHETGGSILDGNGYNWGTKFTAQEDATVAGVRVWSEDIGASDEKHDVAIYNSTFHLLAISSEAQDVGKTSVWSITMSFNTTVTIQAGQEYWLVIDLRESGDRIRYKPSSEFSNQTFYYSGALTSQITPDGYYNYTLCIHAVQTELLVLGRTSPPIASNVNATNNQAGKPSTFHAYWTSERPLDKAVFYWNATGSMQLNGSLALAGTQAWSNFTRTLPDQSCTVKWYILANNTDGIQGNTTVQFLQVTRVEIADLAQIADLTWDIISLREMFADLSSSIFTAWDALVQSVFNVTALLSNAFFWTLDVAWNSAVGLAQTITTLWDALINWDAIIRSPWLLAITWESVISIVVPIDLLCSISTTWNVLISWDVVLDLSRSLSFVWSAAMRSAFDVISCLNAYLTWEAVIQVAYNIVSDITVVTSWLTSVLKGIQHLTNLTLDIVTIWTTDIARIVAEIYATKGFVLAVIFIAAGIGVLFGIGILFSLRRY